MPGPNKRQRSSKASYRPLNRRDAMGRITIGTEELKDLTFWRDVLAEGIATFLLMAAQSSLPAFTGRNLMHVALGMGFVVMVMAEALGPFGGAHMNPAVSVAMLLAKKISVLRSLIYIVVQMVACIGGAGLIFGITPAESRNVLAVTELGANVTVAQGVFTEMWITFQLVTVIFGATDDSSRTLVLPCVPIGFAVALGIMAGGGHTGASMNPARSFGPAVVLNMWKDHWVYWVGPIAGGILACLFRHYLLPMIPRNRSDSIELQDAPKRDAGVEENGNKI